MSRVVSASASVRRKIFLTAGFIQNRLSIAKNNMWINAATAARMDMVNMTEQAGVSLNVNQNLRSRDLGLRRPRIAGSVHCMQAEK